MWTVLMNVNVNGGTKHAQLSVSIRVRVGNNDLNNRWETCGIKIAFQLYMSTDIQMVNSSI